MILVSTRMGVKMPDKSLVTSFPLVDIGISLFLITYCADMLALLISSFAKTTTAAMTIMPFMLIVQLLFSGAFFNLPEQAMPFTKLTATKWGLTALCAQGDYNSLPMVSLWNNAVKMKNYEVGGEKPLQDALVEIEKKNKREEILLKCAEQNQNPNYAFDVNVVYTCWGWIIGWTLFYILVAVIILERIDKDRR